MDFRDFDTISYATRVSNLYEVYKNSMVFEPTNSEIKVEIDLTKIPMVQRIDISDDSFIDLVVSVS